MATYLEMANSPLLYGLVMAGLGFVALLCDIFYGNFLGLYALIFMLGYFFVTSLQRPLISG